MAMLAEPRRKRKWCLDPNGRTWTDDNSKIGMKMLEKMGWSKGDGLGKNGLGMKDPIKVRGNANQIGLGFTGVPDTAWVQHQDDFNSLLSRLNGQSDEEPAKPSFVDPEKDDGPKSLELMSKKSSKRIHYHKFAKSKDLKNASSQDLASIFGILQKNVATEPSSSTTRTSSPASVPNFGVQTTNSGCSVAEYFERKRAAKTTASSQSEEPQPCDQTAAFETEGVNALGKKKRSNKVVEEHEVVVPERGNMDEETPKPKKKKKRSEVICVEDVSVPSEERAVTKKKKKPSPTQGSEPEEDCRLEKKKRKKSKSSSQDVINR